MKNIKLVVGNKNHSSWSLCPWLLLKMFDVEFEEIQIPLFQGNTAEKLGPYSPSLKVPALLQNEVTVWDSLSICEFISENFIKGTGWPINPKRRAHARSISAEVHSEFLGLKNEWPMNCKISYKLAPSEQLRNEIARIDAIWSCCRRQFGQNGNYLYGRFSIADCMFAPIAICFKSYGVELCHEADLYMRTLLENPFVEKWRELGQKEKEIMPITHINTA